MTLNFDKLNGLIPAIIQDSNTQKVLKLGFMNREAFEKTVQEKVVTLFCRTKNRLWTKEIGERRVGKECRSRWSPYH